MLDLDAGTDATLRLLTWNLRFGAANEQWSRLVDGGEFEVSFLQESLSPDDHSALWQAVPGRSWGSAVVVHDGELVPVPVPDFAGWVVGGIWSPPAGRPLMVASVHTPTGRGPYVEETLSILDAIHQATPSGLDVVIGGDFNLLSFGERQEGESLQTKPAERRVLHRVEELGLISAWPHAHPDAPLAQTLRWSGDQTRPFHCDAILLPMAWSPGVSCEVLEDEANASDHLPVAATVTVPPPLAELPAEDHGYDRPAITGPTR